MCNLFSGHVCTEPGKNWGKVLVVTGVHHEKDREHKSVSRFGENLIAWETIKPADVSGGVEIVHTCGKMISEHEKQALIEIVNAWTIKKGNNWFLKTVVDKNGSLSLSGCTLPDGLKLPDSIGGSLSLSGCTLPDGLKLPDSIGGSLYLSGCTLPDGIDLTNYRVIR